MRFILSVLLTLLALPAMAQCVGENLLQTMEPDKRAKLEAAVKTQPYPSGNLWRAQRGGHTIHVMGTMHLTDPRLEAYLAPLWPIVDAADLILLEATRQTMQQLKTAMLSDRSLMFITDGPTLPDRLPTEDWDRLSREMSARGIPGFMVSKMQPWYVSMMLAIPPCAMAGMAKQNGVDQRIMARAATHGIPTRALEEYDVIFSLFGGQDSADEVEMIRMALDGAKDGDRMIATLIEAYLSGEHRAIWELSRLQAMEVTMQSGQDHTKTFATMETKMLTDRNANWMQVILEAGNDTTNDTGNDTANSTGNILVAVGAAHLSGQDGLLSLLEQAGYKLSRVHGF